MVIHLAIAFDQNYLKQFYALCASAVENNRNQELHFHCIATGLSNEEQSQIHEYCKRNKALINFYSIDQSVIEQFVTCGSWTLAAYYRLFFPFLLPQGIDRLLYVDSDALVVNELKELFSQDLEQYPVGAVYDNYVKTQPLIGITEEGHYFNSGVLLIDIPKWKEQRISEQAFAYLDKCPDHIRFVDQCALNAVLLNNWKHLPLQFNCMYTYIPEGMSKAEQRRFIADKVILHFTLQRPWHFLCKNPYRNLYPFYLQRYLGKKVKAIHDFTVSKLPSYLRNRLIEQYHNTALIKKLWRKLK
jgi:lipopolysaccharide biosynthesis glycosyltransferase